VKTTVGKMGLPPTEDGAILPSDLPNPSNQTTSVAESAETTPPRTVPPTCPGPAESRLVPSAIGGVPAWFVDHAEHISRCHPPSLVPPTCPGATHLPRCHPPSPVPPTCPGATHRGISTRCLAPNSANEPIVPFLELGVSYDIGCRGSGVL
jgi:hypothetical protein